MKVRSIFLAAAAASPLLAGAAFADCVYIGYDGTNEKPAHFYDWSTETLLGREIPFIGEGLEDPRNAHVGDLMNFGCLYQENGNKPGLQVIEAIAPATRETLEKSHALVQERPLSMSFNSNVPYLQATLKPTSVELSFNPHTFEPKIKYDGSGEYNSPQNTLARANENYVSDKFMGATLNLLACVHKEREINPQLQAGFRIDKQDKILVTPSGEAERPAYCNALVS